MCWHCRHEWFWNWTNALVTTWMGDLFYENMGNYPNTTIYRANKCWCEWVPNSESLLLLDNEMFKCTFIVENALSFALSEKCLTRFTNLVLMLNNNHDSSICRNTPRKLVPRYRRGISDHIGHLIFVRDVPASGTSLLVVSPTCMRKGGGALQRPGRIFPNQQTCNSRSFEYYKWTRLIRYWTGVS